MHCGYFDIPRKGNHFSFVTPTVVGEQRPFRLKFALKVTHPFEKRRLQQKITVLEHASRGLSAIAQLLVDCCSCISETPEQV